MSSYVAFRPPVRLQLTLSLSPDGSTVAYADDFLGQFNLTVKPLRGGPARRLTSYADQTVRRVAWHPDGRQLMFVADRLGDENSQIYLIDSAGGEPQALTHVPSAQHAGALGNPFSPDGRWLAYMANDRWPRDQDVLVRSLETGTVTRLFAPGGRMNAGFWSPDSNRLTIAEWPDENTDHVIHVADVESGAVRRITFNDDPAVFWLGPWLPDCSGFFVLTNAGRDFDGLAVLNAETGKITWADTPEWDVERVAGSTDGQTLVWTVDVDGASQLRGRNVAVGTDLRVPDLPLGAASRLAVSDDGKTAALLMSTPTMPINILRADLSTNDLHWVTDDRPEALADCKLGGPVLIRYPSRLGDEVPAYVYMPDGTSDPVGVVISVHGGPTIQERPNYPYGGLYQYLQDQGIAVFAPNIHGSSGYGATYQSRIYRDWGGVDLDDIDAAMTYLLQQPWVDPDRIGLFGGSYGGFVVLSALSRLPHRTFAGAVVYFGPSNLVTLAKAAPPTWHSLVERVIGNPETDYEFLMSRSPVNHCDNVTAPLLMLQGANDPRVPRSESDQVVDRLRARGVEVDYRIFPDEGHGFTKTTNEIAARTATAQFFIQHLAP